MRWEDIQMGAVGPDEETIETGSISVPRQSGPIELPEEAKQEIAFVYEVGSRKVSNAMAVLRDKRKMEFLLEELLPDNGLIYVGGLSATGKTILATQVIANLVLGQPAMTWKIGEKFKDQHLRVLMLSLEMNRKQLQMRLGHMFPNLTEEQEKLFEDNFLTYDEPEAFELWNIAHILELTQIIKACNINVLLIDSASVSFANSLKDDAQVNQSIKNLYRLRTRLDFSVIVVAHTRKPPAGIASNPEDVTLNELFGHSGVAQSADAILIMLEDEKERKAIIRSGTDPDKVEKLVHIINAKSRFGTNSGSFKSYLTSKANVDKGEPLMFRRKAIAIEMTEEAKRKLKSTKIDLTDAMKDAFADVDFGEALGGDE